MHTLKSYLNHKSSVNTIQTFYVFNLHYILGHFKEIC